MDDRDRFLQAFRSLDRADFLEGPVKSMADEDHPLPIGYGQTISQPSLVLLMTRLLDPRPDDKVLEIGTGSGFQAALLAQLAGTVHTIERIPQLSAAASARLERLGCRNVVCHVGDGSDGLPGEAPFDRIMVTVAAARMPDALLDQLAPGGRMILPVGQRWLQDLRIVDKTPDGRVYERNYESVVFVEFVGRYGFG